MPTLRIFLACLLTAVVGAAQAQDKYDSETICPKSTSGRLARECDHFVERTVSKDVPGVIERKGLVLRIRAKNGKRVERRNVDVDGEKAKEVWVCDYFPDRGYIRLCHRFWESSGTEFVNIENGAVTFVDGWPRYSPSRERILLIDGYGGEVYKIEVWRFGPERLEKEFQIKPPPDRDWEAASWKSDAEIALARESVQAGPKPMLTRQSGRWELRER